jgi:hypothetical protein
MSTVKIIPFLSEHLASIEKRDGVLYDDTIGEVYEAYPSITITDADRIIFCGGIVYQNETDGIAWLRTVPDIRQYKEILIRTINNFIQINVNLFGLKSLRARVQADFIDGLKMMTLLGCKQERLLKDHAYGKDFYLYAFPIGD